MIIYQYLNDLTIIICGKIVEIVNKFHNFGENYNLVKN